MANIDFLNLSDNSFFEISSPALNNYKTSFENPGHIFFQDSYIFSLSSICILFSLIKKNAFDKYFPCAFNDWLGGITSKSANINVAMSDKLSKGQDGTPPYFRNLPVLPAIRWNAHTSKLDREQLR